MERAVRFALRRSRAVLVGWVGLIAVCAALGVVYKDSFTPTDFIIPGSQGEQWRSLSQQAGFGTNVTVLLTGPPRQLRSQAIELALRLRAESRIRVVSPFDATGAAAGGAASRDVATVRKVLRKGDSALLLVDIRLARDAPLFDAVPPVRRAVDAVVRGPVVAHVTGQAAVADGLRAVSYSATRTAELIAVPLLVLVLLFVFRSPVAAAIPGVMGLGTVIAGGGVVEAIAATTNVDQVALNLASMMGLALGVDYSLLLVSRYREEQRGADGDVDRRIVSAGRSAGHTIAVAALLLTSVMVAAAVLSPGPLLFSIALGVCTVTIFAAGTALMVAPALLKVADPWLDRWALPQRVSPLLGSRIARRQPLVVPLVALAGLLLLASPTLGMRTGSPDVKLLPDGDAVRSDYEYVNRVAGPGFGAIFDVALESKRGPLTGRPSLARILAFQRRLERDRDVVTVIGPATLAAPVTGMNAAVDQLRRARSLVSDGRRATRGLGGELRKAKDGTKRLASGLDRATSAARAIATGTSSASDGTRDLALGLQHAKSGLNTAVRALNRASAGAGSLAHGLEQAASVARKMASGARGAERRVRGTLGPAGASADRLATGADEAGALREPVATALKQLDKAMSGLKSSSVAKLDPQYKAITEAVGRAQAAISGTNPLTGEQIRPDYPGMDSALAQASAELRTAAAQMRSSVSDATQLANGLAKLARANGQLGQGLSRMRTGALRLRRGLRQLHDGLAGNRSRFGSAVAGVDALRSGLGRLHTGARQLGSGLDVGAARVRDSAGQLGTFQTHLSDLRGTAGSAGGVSKALEEIERFSPALIRSGMLPLAAVEGGDRVSRDRGRLVIDTAAGGRIGRVLVIPRYGPTDPRFAALYRRVAAAASDLRHDDLRAAVGGPAAVLLQFKNALNARLPLLIAAFALISLVILTMVFRALPLAAGCVVLNLLSVGVAFGVMNLAFGGSHPPLGGPGYVDVVALLGTVTVVFALSIDYQIFLLGRIREEYVSSGSHERSITAAIGASAKVITGAAIVMIAVFVAFATSSFIGIREIGVGLAVAVFLDATVVRLLLLPAFMRLCGQRTWWLPAVIDRRLPRISL